MLFDNDIATVITIQWYFRTFWGTFGKIWLFLWKKIAWNSSITRKIFHLEPCNLVENCPIDSSFRHISHYLPNISYVVFTILNAREGYSYPQNPEFLAICCSLNFMQEAWKVTTKLHIHNFITYVCNDWLTFWSLLNKIGSFFMKKSA